MIKIFQHRANDLRTWPLSDYCEIDVQIDRQTGRPLIYHNPDEQYPTEIGALLPRYKGFLVDIKQNMPLEYLNKIAAAFGNKFEGFIDVPYPCLVEVRRQYRVWERCSEYEQASYSEFETYLDPLMSWDLASYNEIMLDIQSRGAPYYKAQTIVAAPDLHGVAAVNSLQVISALVKEYPQIYGVITKNPVELKKCLES